MQWVAHSATLGAFLKHVLLFSRIHGMQQAENWALANDLPNRYVVTYDATRLDCKNNKKHKTQKNTKKTKVSIAL